MIALGILAAFAMITAGAILAARNAREERKEKAFRAKVQTWQAAADRHSRGGGP